VNTWHLDDDLLGAYRDRTTQTVLAASVEAHLLACSECRQRLAGTDDATARATSDRRWAALAAEVDEPRRTPLLRLGLATRPLRNAWLASVALLVLVPLAAATFVGLGSPTLLLALAPLAPLAAVVVAYRTDLEPAGELALATPLAGLRLVVRRAVLVGVTALPLVVGAAALAGLPMALALGWVLPGLALASLVLLAGSTRLDPTQVAAVLGGVWALAVGVPSAVRRSAADAVADQVGAAPIQLACLVVALAAVALTVSRREHIAYRRTA
jgi:hypothetical protein